MNAQRFGVALVAGFWLLATGAHATEPRIMRDLEYARVGDLSLKLDLYVPVAGSAAPPVIVWVHGGAWRSGSKNNPSILPLTEQGYAVASVDYRLSPVARFPAQVHDLKAAIRYLRASAAQQGINAQRIAISGGSAGGHLAALVGVTNGHKELEGEVGLHGNQSSDVQAIVSFFGASNLTTILSQSTPHGLNVRVPALALLLAGEADASSARATIEGIQRGEFPPTTDVARLASPVFHVDKSDPPVLWFHGEQDPQMPIAQAHELIGAYKQHGLPADLEVVYGGVHGGKLFYTPRQLQRVADFLQPILKP